MKLIRHSQWTNVERLDLLRICSDETVEKDWRIRADEMSRRYSKLGIFFTAKVLHSEFERILSAPCPGIEPNISGQYSYSHKVLMEKWIAHFSKVIEEENSKKSELAMVEIRRCTSLIEKLLADKMSLEEMGDLLEKMKMEDPKKEDDIQFRRVVSTYSNRLLHVWKETGRTVLNPGESMMLPPTIKKDEEEGGSGFMTPTYNSSAITAIASPIRSVAEAMKDAVPIFAEPIPPPPAVHIPAPSASPQQQQKSAEIQDVKMEDDISVKSEGSVPPDRPDTPKNHPNRRRASAVPPKAEVQDPEILAVPQIPPVKKLTGKRRRELVESADSFEIPSAPMTPMPTEWRDQECQTEVSIKSVVGTTVSASPRRSAASANTAATPLRKSSRRSEKPATPAPTPTPSANSLNTSGTSSNSSGLSHSIGCQTSRVEFEKDDVVTFYYAPESFADKISTELVNLERKKSAGGKRQGEETMMEIQNEKAADDNASGDESATTSHARRGSKSESRRELTYIVDTQTALAQKLIDEKSYKLFREIVDTATAAAATDSPVVAKRARKDDRKDDSRFLLNNMLRILTEHKYSSIFMQPVTEKDAPGYTNTIKIRVDLATLRKEIDSGQVTTRNQFMLKAYTMFANAVMFNCTGHDANTYAKNMVRDLMTDILTASSEERKGGISRRSKIIDEARSSHRSQSMEPEQIPYLGVPGNQRQLFKRAAQTASNIIKKMAKK